MPFNRKTLRDLIELYAGQGGVSRDRIPPKLINRVIDMKLQEFGRRTGILSSMSSFTTDGTNSEYELAGDVTHITKVNFDGAVAHKIRFEDVDKLAENVS